MLRAQLHPFPLWRMAMGTMFLPEGEDFGFVGKKLARKMLNKFRRARF